MTKSDGHLQEIDFDSSLPLFADYFARLNIQHEQEAEEIARKLVEEEEVKSKQKLELVGTEKSNIDR